ncbi:uncharacterized protein LOC126785871 [Argentina anserina]|uniref:uncharacterized protein LOC126785871 n=1 Tax=Argentina anserina TaxID=57926 RepID=UPI0021767EAA|nr:uncharacterized protein LOC126785871 [Potentilla anserina]
MKSNPKCPVCGGEDESIEHALLLCPWVKLVWFGSPLGMKINMQAITTFDCWLLHNYQSYKSKEDRDWALTMISFICWFIWKARCRFVYRATPCSPELVISLSSYAAFEFLSTKIHIPASMITFSESPTLPGTVVVCTDACWVDELKGGVGVVIFDHLGHHLGGLAVVLKAENAEIAEARAVLTGVDLALQRGYKSVRFRSDSQNVISELQTNRTCINWKTSIIMEEITWRCRFFDRIDWEWIPREANRAAHEAAKLGFRTVGLRCWSETPPPSLTMVLRNDGFPCPH